MQTNICEFLQNLVGAFRDNLLHDNFILDLEFDEYSERSYRYAKHLGSVTIVFYNTDKSEFVSIIIDSNNEYSIRRGWDYSSKDDNYSIEHNLYQETFQLDKFIEACKKANWLL